VAAARAAQVTTKAVRGPRTQIPVVRPQARGLLQPSPVRVMRECISIHTGAILSSDLTTQTGMGRKCATCWKIK
jgi:hypothetical protein